MTSPMSFSDILTKVDISFLLNKRTDVMYFAEDMRWLKQFHLKLFYFSLGFILGLLIKRGVIMYLILILMIGFGILMAGMILNASYRRQIRRLKEYEGRNKL